jgi:hypothetical protein
MSFNIKENIVCKPTDAIETLKQNILELISLNKTTCNNLPQFNIPRTLPNVPDLNPSQAVIDFLTDILAIVSGINFDEMRMQLISWLVEQLSPLEKDLTINFNEALKECFACKVSPKIPSWMYVTQPNTTTDGVGLNIELSKVDLGSTFAINPNSEVGKLSYDGNDVKDMNAFLWEVIQKNGTPLVWKDPVNGREIAEFRYYENSPVAFTESINGVGYQNSVPKQRVFNMRIVNTYQNESLITFMNDYFSSQSPLFDVDRVIPEIIDQLYGTISSKIDLDDASFTKKVEFEEAIIDYVNGGIDNIDVEFDDSFYEFSPSKVKNIKDKVEQKKLGIKVYKNCCSNEYSYIPYQDTLNGFNEIKSATTLNQRIETYTRTIENLIESSSKNVKSTDKSLASAEFLANFISSLQISITKIVLSPKNLMMVNFLFFLVNEKPIESGDNVKKFLKSIECVIRKIIGDIIRKIIYGFLLPLVLKALKNLIVCVITKKIKEKNLNYLRSLNSLTPPSINVNVERINELFGKVSNVTSKVRSATDSININSLNNVNLQFGKKGRSC